MTGGRQESCLADVGFLGGRLGQGQFAVEVEQFRRALLDPAFEGLVGPLQGLCRLDALRDIGEGYNHAAIGHGIGANLQHRAGAMHRFRVCLHTHDKAINTFQHHFVDLAFAELAAGGVMPKHFVQGHAHPAEVCRQTQQYAELAVPADQAQILVKHGNALAHLVEGRLQQVAVVLDGGGRVVQQFHGAAGMDAVSFHQQGEHQSRRRSTYGTGKQVFGKPQQPDVGFHVGMKVHVPACGELGK